MRLLGKQMRKRGRKIRSWRRHWVCEPVSRTAVHTSGVIVRVSPSPTDPSKDRITLERTSKIDMKRWDLGRLMQEALLLWMEGEF